MAHQPKFQNPEAEKYIKDVDNHTKSKIQSTLKYVTISLVIIIMLFIIGI